MVKVIVANGYQATRFPGFLSLVGEFLSAGWAEPALATEGHFLKGTFFW